MDRSPGWWTESGCREFCHSKHTCRSTVSTGPNLVGEAMARRWRADLLVAVSILACVQFVIVVDETTVGLVAPVIARDLSLGSSARHVLITPFACAFVCGLPVAGLLLRRVAPVRTLAPTVVSFAVSAVVGGCAVTTAQLVVTRAAQGFSAAMVTTGVLAALHTATRADPRRMRAFAGFSLLSGSGALAALLVVGPIADVSWRWCFWGIGAAAAVCALWWKLCARARSAQPGGVGDVVPWVGIDPTTTAAMGAVVATNALLTAAVITASFTLQADRGWSAAMTGVGLLPLNAAAAIGTLMVATSSDRAGGAVPAIGATALAIGGAAITWWAGVLGSTQWLLLATIPLGLGVGVVFPLMNSRSMDTAGALSMGRAAQLGAAAQVGVAVGALVASAHWSFGPAGLASIAAVAVIVDGVLRR